ncbi:hypothetical protein [Polluticoccus soli]|uniref:hypothetical protein n=1 Tax=Polluticoccus soli TaxID=3034150 RepID=UPI0023E0F857|nr:hypothetical protein [Flavipsychrobacter sp. JY13-12]
MFRLVAIIVLIFNVCLPRAQAQFVYFNQPFSDTVVCHGKTVTLGFTTTGTFQNGNVFTAQLSDVTGNFVAPIDIGSVTAKTSDNITVTFPIGLVVGKGYRMRLISTLPMIISPDNGSDIRIEYVPNAPIVSNNSPVCEHDTLLVKVTNAGSSQTDSIVWSGGILSAPAQASALSVNDAPIAYSGTYNIVRYSKSSKCPSPVTQTIVWVQPLPPNPTASATPTVVCEGETVQLNATSTPLAPGFEWSGPHGFADGSKDPYIAKVAASGEGWYKVRSVEAGCYSGKVDSVWLDVIPAPKLSITTNSPLCEGGELQAKATDTGNIVYAWKGPNGFQVSDSALTIPNAKTSSSGTYYIHTVRNGCNGVDSIDLRVKPYPYPTVLNANSPVCEGDTLLINTVQIIQPGVVTYQFTGPNGESFGPSFPMIPNVTKTAEGKYILRSDIDGCSRTDSVAVIIKPTPVVTTDKEFMVTVQKPVQLTANSSIAGTSFHWKGPNGFSSNEQNPTIPSVTERNKGVYTVTGNFAGCSSDTSTEVGVWYLTDYTLFDVIPNPNNGVFDLVGRVKKPQVVEIAIYHGGSGVVLYKDKIQSNGKLIDTRITLHSHLAPGEYILRARADGEVQGVKFIILH